MSNFTNDLEYRSRDIHGIDREWLWPKEEDGWEGPIKDYPSFEAAVLKYVPSRGKIIQAGSWMGLYPILLARHFNHVYTFEADSLCYACVDHNTWDFDNITPYNLALSDKCGTVQLTRRYPGNIGETMTKDSVNYRSLGAEFEVAATTLDYYEFTDIDAILLDIEGSEHAALMGGQKLIESQLPTIALETVTGKTRDMLYALGYKEEAVGGMDKFFVHESKLT